MDGCRAVQGCVRLRTDFRNLRVDVLYDGRKKEILSQSSFERDDDECGCVWKSRFEFFICLYLWFGDMS